MLALVLASCGGDDDLPPRRRQPAFLWDLDLNENRAFAMAFGSKGQLVVSGTSHNKRPAIATWNADRETWEKLDVPEQLWLESLPSGEVVGVGTKTLYAIGFDALKIRPIGEISPSPRTAFNQASARAAGDGAIFFVLDAGSFQRIAPGGTTATAIPIPPGTPETALPGTYARTGDGRMFAGVRGAGIYEVFADRAEMIVPCADPEIGDCNGGEILVVDSYANAPLFRGGPTAGKVYRLDLETRRLRLVVDLSALDKVLLTSVADAPNGDIYAAIHRSEGGPTASEIVKVPAGSAPAAFASVADEFVVGPASLAVSKDGRVFSNGGFLIQQIK